MYIVHPFTQELSIMITSKCSPGLAWNFETGNKLHRIKNEEALNNLQEDNYHWSKEQNPFFEKWNFFIEKQEKSKSLRRIIY